MKNYKNLIGLAAMALCLGLTSCSSSDDAPSYSNVVVSNSELMTLLKSKGYTFDENGKLLLDDKANATTSLDLSGTQVDTASLKELAVFPNLKELNLSNNGYGDSFDFSVLPTQVTGIDLTNNDIYNYDNLVKVTVEENGDENVENLRNITRLYLPEEAKYNIAQLMRFYRQNKSAIDGGTMDVEMQNANGSLEKYNTLREIPDETLRKTLKETFSQMFNGEKIDISNYILDDKQRIAALQITDGVSNFEGIQYVVESPYWNGASIVLVSGNSETKVPTLNLSTNINSVTLSNVSVDGINLPNDSQLRYIYMENVASLKMIDLSKSVVFGQRSGKDEMDAATGSGIIVYDCPSIESIILPNKEDLRANYLDIECLPSLKQFDMSKFVELETLIVGDLPETYNLVYPNLKEFGDTQFNATMFAISKNAFNAFKDVSDTFIKKYYQASPSCLIYQSYMSSDNNKAYKWSKYY